MATPSHRLIVKVESLSHMAVAGTSPSELVSKTIQPPAAGLSESKLKINLYSTERAAISLYQEVRIGSLFLVLTKRDQRRVETSALSDGNGKWPSFTTLLR